MEDRQLIQEYVTHHSDVAFCSLVNRYIHLVHGVAVRQTPDPQLADDVTQVVFILLARKAATLSTRVILSGWLYQTTRFVARRAARSELRRRRYEQEAFQMREISPPEETWRRLAPLLDEAMDKLGSTDRTAILMRFFEEKPLREVGRTLGLSEDAARKRIDRSMEKLRAFFARRGFAVSAGGLSSALTSRGAEILPAGYGNTIASLAYAHSMTPASTLPALGRRALSAQKLAHAALLAGIAASLVLGGFVALQLHTAMRRSTAVIDQPEKAPPASPAPASPVAATAPIEITNKQSFAFRAVDAVTGTGLSGARILALAFTGEYEYQLLTNLVTDAAGRCEVPFPGKQLMAVGVLADGYEQKCVFVAARAPIPSQYTLQIPGGVTIGGVVKDESGNPVSGAAIAVTFAGIGDYNDREFQRERTGFPDDIPLAVTDTSGHWTFASASQTNQNISIAVTHPDFTKASFGAPAETLRFEDLRSGNAVLILKKGLILTGVVTDQQQKPIVAAKVHFGDFDLSPQKTVTAQDGSFTLSHLPFGDSHLLVMAEGYAPERMQVAVRGNSAPISVTLSPGNRLRIRVVDESSRPINRARVTLQAWRGFNTLGWNGASSADGSLEWNSAPPDEMNICAYANGYCYSRDNLITADGHEHVITLHRQFTVSGLVTDSKSGHPVSSFKVMPENQRSDLVEASNGVYELKMTEYSPSLRLQFEAEGYDATDSPPLNPTGSNVVCNISLHRTGPRDYVQGIVLLPDGTPAAGVEVGLCVPGRFTTIGPGKFIHSPHGLVVKTDGDGEFSFLYVSDPRSVVAVSKKGFGRAVLGRTNLAVSIALQPWGRLEGHLKLSHESSNDRKVGITGSGRLGGLGLEFYAQSDAQGHFVIDPAPTVPCKLYVYPIGGVGTLRHETLVEIRPGSTVNIQIGGIGCSLAGHFILEKPTTLIDWSRQLLFPDLATQYAVPQPVPKGYWDSEEGIAQSMAVRHCTVDVKPDGSFEIDEVLPGAYILTGNLSSLPVDPSVPSGIGAAMNNLIGQINKSVTVPEGEPADAILDVGNVPVKVSER